MDTINSPGKRYVTTTSDDKVLILNGNGDLIYEFKFNIRLMDAAEILTLCERFYDRGVSSGKYQKAMEIRSSLYIA